MGVADASPGKSVQAKEDSRPPAQTANKTVRVGGTAEREKRGQQRARTKCANTAGPHLVLTPKVLRCRLICAVTTR